jgi:hypothetical protein
MLQLAIDVGYSSTKVKYDNKYYKFPSAISFATDLGIDYGDSTDTVNYKGETYYVGDAAVGLESFTTTDYAFKSNFDPVIIYHVLKKLDLVQDALNKNIKLYLTLALTDWKFKDNYLEVMQNFQVDDITVGFEDIVLIPQGAGVYMQYVAESGDHPLSAAIIDVGYNTINYLTYEHGQPQKAHSKGFAGHGVSSIIKSFSAYLENTFSMPFSEAEALKIFMNNKFIFSGIERTEVADKIIELKSQFVKRLFNSVLTSEKKLLATSEKVLLAGGGCYLLEGINFPPNVQFAAKPYEFANISGVIG